jgi:hypothetical protein
MCCNHKVLAYVEYRAVPGVFQNIDPPPSPPSPPSECVLPPHQGGGYTLSGRRGGWGGVNILEDARHWIGLLQFNLSTAVMSAAELSVGFFCDLFSIRRRNKGSYCLTNTAVQDEIGELQSPLWIPSFLYSFSCLLQNSEDETYA